jgi:integrase
MSSGNPNNFQEYKIVRKEITHELLANLPTPSDGARKLEVVSASKSHQGLYLEIHRGGNVTWRFRYKSRITGKTTHLRIGSLETVPLEAAFTKACEYRQRLDAGLEPVVLETPTPIMPTFREFFQETYIPIVSERKRSWKRDEEIFRLRLGDIADTRLDQITRLDLMKLHNKLKASGLAAATANHGLKVARQALGLAVRLEIIQKNVASGIPLFREDNVRDRFLSAEELGRLIKVLKTDKNRPVCRILLMAIYTGARSAEIFSCRYSDLDFENKVWRIPAAAAKTKKSRLVPLNDGAIEALKEVEYTGQAYAFPNPRTGRPYTTISKVWERLRSDAGLGDAIIYLLRHSWASLLAANQENAFTISKLMGHSSVKMSERYTHFGQATLLDASNRAAKSINDALKETP